MWERGGIPLDALLLTEPTIPGHSNSIIHSSIAQLVEQVTVNHPVPGSSPGGGVCHHSTVVVQGFCKAKVGSSNLSDGIL